MHTHASSLPVALAKGAVLRIDGGRGLSIRAVSGNVWITESGRPDDLILADGQSTRLRRWGRAVVTAWHPARLVLGRPVGLAPSLTIAPGEGEAGRILARGSWIAQALHRVLRSLAGLARQARSSAWAVHPAPRGRLEVERELRGGESIHRASSTSPEDARDRLRRMHPHLF